MFMSLVRQVGDEDGVDKFCLDLNRYISVIQQRCELVAEFVNILDPCMNLFI